MKVYGARKATEFTKKQIGVIFSKAKNGELIVEKFAMRRMYDLADYYGYDDNRSVEDDECTIMSILNDIFEGNMDEAQEKINDYAEKLYRLSSNKIRKTMIRGELV